MTKQEAITAPAHKSIAAALAAAQMQMGKALKQSSNPHFKSKYADLASVVDACMPALNINGIAVVQPTIDDETGRYVKTIFIHSESGEELECRVPLIVQKNDMQGYGSAVTYARRYGLMGMAGIAPEDDDGNAAKNAAPQQERTVTPDQYIKLRDLAADADVDEAKLCERYGASDLQQFPLDKFASAVTALNKTIAAKRPDDLAGDEIPYHNEEEHA